LQVADAAATPELRRAALWQAAELYRGAGQREQAYATFKRYAEEFPAPIGQQIEAYQQLLELALEAGHHKSARTWRRAIIQADADAGRARSDRTRFLAAPAALALAELPREAYDQVRLVEPLQENLRKKKASFQKTLAAYERAAAYK